MQLDFFAKLAERIKGALDLPALKIERIIPAASPTTPTPGDSPQPTIETLSASSLQDTARLLLRGIGHGDLADRVQVRWNPRMRSTAGMAYPAKALITLNSRLPAFGAEEIDRTLRHELAHLLAHHRAGRRRIARHGAEWQRACGDLGIHDEKRCHDLPLPRRKVARRFVYRCPHCAAEIRRTRPLRGKSACLACCRRHHGGRYNEKFRFVKVNG